MVTIGKASIPYVQLELKHYEGAGRRNGGRNIRLSLCPGTTLTPSVALLYKRLARQLFNMEYSTSKMDEFGGFLAEGKFQTENREFSYDIVKSTEGGFWGNKYWVSISLEK
jgi:hypothetical protein